MGQPSRHFGGYRRHSLLEQTDLMGEGPGHLVLCRSRDSGLHRLHRGSLQPMKREAPRPFQQPVTFKSVRRGVRTTLPDPTDIRQFKAMGEASQMLYLGWITREAARLDKPLVAPAVSLLSAAAALIGVTFAMQVPRLTAQDEKYEDLLQSTEDLRSALLELKTSGAPLPSGAQGFLETKSLEAFSFAQAALSSLWSFVAMLMLAAVLTYASEWWRAHNAGQLHTWMTAIQAANGQPDRAAESAESGKFGRSSRAITRLFRGRPRSQARTPLKSDNRSDR